MNKAKSVDTEAPFLGLDISIANVIVLNYDKRNIFFFFEIANLPFLDEEVPHATSHTLF